MSVSSIKTRVAETVAEQVERLNGELRDASAQTILRAALVREWVGKTTYVSSFGAESACMLALIADVDPSMPIIFFDTGMHFPQTLDYRDALIERLGLTDVRTYRPDEAERARVDPKNNLWKTDTDACCNLRKVAPARPGARGL